MNHEEARGFLGNSLLMCDLALTELQSAAQIAQLLSGRHQIYSRQAIEVLLSGFRVSVELDAADVSALFDEDSASDLAQFADADLATATNYVSATVSKFGFVGAMNTQLEALTPQGTLSRYGPYLQVLHFQCTIAEFFDHAVTDLYEFSPRGVIAQSLFERYPPTIASAGNPFLNNMKSVAKIDEIWALGKKPAELPGAQALWRILAGLESLGFAARREVCKLLRIWVHRVIRLSLPTAVVLPPALTQVHVDALVAWVAGGNTATFGIVEQRVVDTIASGIHPLANGWRSRGVGDSVNATNVSRKKIGDCDFQNTGTRSIVAYESHGGTLTDVYVKDHLRTLRKVLDERVSELSATAEPADWTIKLVFVAHELETTPWPPMVVNGIPTVLEFKTFTEFVAELPNLAAWNQTLLSPLTANRTPMEVKQATLDVIGP
jgi:hypothetical protein